VRRSVATERAARKGTVVTGAIRVGIDVGGTFTDAVAIDAQTREPIARAKVPTTHGHPDGVAAGIVAALHALLAAPGVEAERIAFLAHSTTQATNALLEGDVARVGVVGVLGSAGAFARSQIAVPPMRLGRTLLDPIYRFVRAGDPEAARRAVDDLAGNGAEAIAASEAFGVDREAAEAGVVAYARSRDLPATAGHEVATLYGLRARTRTAILNASILPRMVQTSRMTAGAVASAGIGAPLMIMRSDGGVMDVREVARKPILTMLSGPAAGIAGALLHENVTDGIFIEVGGTSSDLSVIRRGLPQVRTARIGAHRTMLRSLDVRTIAVAGGSLLRVRPRVRGPGCVIGAGPRSAHIAGLAYAAFTAPEALRGATIAFVEPGQDGAYVAFDLPRGGRAALTPTCAANLLGTVPAGAFAQADAAGARLAFEIAGAALGCAPEELARAMLDACAAAARAAVGELVRDYDLDPQRVELVGGGGGAGAIVPYVASALGMRSRIARDAEVISPIGVALALVRDVVERTIVAPSPADIVRVRREAIERVVASGADPALVETTIELDAARNVVRAIAQGATAAGSRPATAPATSGEREQAAAGSLGAPEVELAGTAGSLWVYRAAAAPPRGWRARVAPPPRWSDLCVVDARAVARSSAFGAAVRFTTAGEVERAAAALLEETTSFGDVGRALPALALAYGDRVAQLGALGDAAQAVALAREEVGGLDPSSAVAIVAIRRTA
jgi:N-methylhydantoinase A/oxoprolinase/acetone carboxylase beta subunit